jgi:hypothetical protein
MRQGSDFSLIFDLKLEPDEFIGIIDSMKCAIKDENNNEITINQTQIVEDNGIIQVLVHPFNIATLGQPSAEIENKEQPDGINLWAQVMEETTVGARLYRDWNAFTVKPKMETIL